jgi:hypothetical protein
MRSLLLLQINAEQPEIRRCQKMSQFAADRRGVGRLGGQPRTGHALLGVFGKFSEAGGVEDLNAVFARGAGQSGL